MPPLALTLKPRITPPKPEDRGEKEKSGNNKPQSPPSSESGSNPTSSGSGSSQRPYKSCLSSSQTDSNDSRDQRDRRRSFGFSLKESPEEISAAMPTMYRRERSLKDNKTFGKVAKPFDRFLRLVGFRRGKNKRPGHFSNLWVRFGNVVLVILTNYPILVTNICHHCLPLAYGIGN